MPRHEADAKTIEPKILTAAVRRGYVRIAISRLARDAGVGEGTARRVIYGGGPVSATARARVLRALGVATTA